jgi:preprotein translocase subunit SecG
MLLAADWYHSILATLFALLAVLLMGVILLQRGKGVGLSGAFGGAGGHTAFGAKTGDVLTWATIVIAATLLVFAVILNYIFVPLKPPAPAAPVVSPSVPAMPTGGATTPTPSGPAPEGSDSPPASETPAPPRAEQPAETPPGGGGDVPGWPDIFGADPD